MGFDADLLIAGTGFLLYSLPAMVAGARQHHNQLAIVLLNLLLGWTVLGWVLALVWACTASRRSSGSNVR